MNKKRIAQYCCAALVAAGIGLNIQNAIADYGIAENSFSLVAVGGSNSGSNSNSNSNTGPDDDLVHNGYKNVVIRTHSGWKSYKTNTWKYHTVTKNGETTTHRDYLHDFEQVNWNECQEMSIELAGFRPLCTPPKSAEEAGVDGGGSTKPLAFYACDTNSH